MLSALLGFIPIVGPIVQGLTSAFSSYTSLESTRIQANADVGINETRTAAQIIHDTSDDIGLRLLRDMVCLPVVVWSMFIGWDTIVVRVHPDWVWIVEKYPDSVSYLPYAVLIFLLGNIGFNTWKRK